MVFGGTRRRGLDLTSMSEDGSPFQTRGRKARREGGGYQDNPQTRSIFVACLSAINSLFAASLNPPHPPEQALAFAHNSETTGDGAKMFNSDEYIRVEHLRTQTPSKMGPLLYPVPGCFKVEQAASGSPREKSLFFRVG